jgi:hypothetical protein
LSVDKQKQQKHDLLYSADLFSILSIDLELAPQPVLRWSAGLNQLHQDKKLYCDQVVE